MRSNILNQFVAATTSTLVTPLTSTAQLTYSVPSAAALSHREDTLDPIGVFIQWSAITLAGSNTYRIQVQQSTDAAAQTAVLTVADTGAMAITDTRLVNNTGLFLAIDWNLVTEKYLSVLVTLAGDSTPSISILLATLCQRSEVPAFTTVAANYNP